MKPHSPADHAHSHVFLGAGHARHERATRWVVALTAAMMVAEIIAGLLTGSMALLADGIHMATHAGALAVAAAAYAYARKHAENRRFAFGTGKIGDLVGFASALALGLTALGVLWESLSRLVHPGQVAFDEALLVAVLGLIVNLLSARLLHDREHSGHGHAHHGHHHHHGGGDNNLRAAYAHVLTDALTSVLAIAALMGGRWLGWTWLDPIMGVVGALVILHWARGLMRDTALVLTDASDPAVAAAIRARLEQDGAVLVSDLHVWRLGPDALAAIVEVVGHAPESAESYKARLRDIPGLAHVTVEVTTCDVCRLSSRPA